MKGVYSPGGQSSDQPLMHHGEEVAYLIEGSLEVNIEDNIFTMNAGDSVRIPPYTRHKFCNKTDKEAVLIFAITPPDF